MDKKQTEQKCCDGVKSTMSNDPTETKTWTKLTDNGERTLCKSLEKVCCNNRHPKHTKTCDQ